MAISTRDQWLRQRPTFKSISVFEGISSMTKGTSSNSDGRTEAGVEERRDALLLKLLKTPPEHRPKRERKKPESVAENDTQR